MLAIQVGRRRRGDEELGPVGVLPSVRHAQKVFPVVPRRGVYPAGVCALGPRGPFVVEAAAVDGLAACAVALCGVAALDHEALDYAVEGGGLVVEGGAAELAETFLAGAQAAEILYGAGGDVLS